MEKLSRIVGAVTEIASGQLSAWLIFGFMCLVLVEVVTRYILRSPLMLADEIGGYTLVAIAFMGLAYTWKKKGHVRIEVVTSRLPTKIQNWLRLITLTIATAFTPVLIWASYELVAYSHSRGVRSNTWLRTLQEWPQMVLIIGSVLLLLPVITELVQAIRNVRAFKEEGGRS